jgi:hypothetical protein
MAWYLNVALFPLGLVSRKRVLLVSVRSYYSRIGAGLA